MNRRIYENCMSDSLTLNDHLAIERTSLANERTLLSYVRTMIGLIAVGGTLIKFFNDRMIIYTGFVFLLVGFITMIIGFLRYLRMYIFIHEISEGQSKFKLKEDHLQYFLLIMLQKLHLAPSNIN